MNIQKQSPYGKVHIKLKNEVVNIESETDLGAYWAQGFAAAKLRLWQLDLSRRVASGELSEILGKNALRIDLFQRKLGLRELAKREVGKESLQSKQVKAYIEGLNASLKTIKILPFECLILNYRPKPFTEEDVYVIAQLKYFINSAWQYEMFHTNMLARLTPKQSRELFSTFTDENNLRPPLTYISETERSELAQKAFKDALEGLKLLGLSSPDTGSNVFAVNPSRSDSNEALLAADPHMGQVNPGFSLLCHLKSEEGLNVFGANFPGVPGVVVGRNEHVSWGMVGLMADNQDVSYAEIDLENLLVRENNEWVPLQKIEETLKIKGLPDQKLISYRFDRGRLLEKKGHYGLFLRWPALDSNIGDITLYDLAKSYDWESFKKGLSNVYNAPMVAGYADTQGNIGLHAVGLLPKREVTKEGEHLGAILQNQDNPSAPWHSYLPFDELPNIYNPPEGYVIYANQYSEQLFDKKHAISNRWHPPTRFLRIKTLIESKEKLSLEDMQVIQDDKIDLFAEKEAPYLLSFLDEKTILDNWQGDTTKIQENLLFERWIFALAHRICAPKMGKKSFALYTDFCSSFRWNILDIFRHHLTSWLNEKDLALFHEDPMLFRKNLVQNAFEQANIQLEDLPVQHFQHSLKKPPFIAWLLTGKGKYLGGNRETVHATRQNVDFLTSSQVNFKTKKQKPFSFGPAFKFANRMDHDASIRYIMNTPAKGRPFFWSFNANFKKWQSGFRYQLFLNKKH